MLLRVGESKFKLFFFEIILPDRFYFSPTVSSASCLLLHRQIAIRSASVARPYKRRYRDYHPVYSSSMICRLRRGVRYQYFTFRSVSIDFLIQYSGFGHKLRFRF